MCGYPSDMRTYYLITNCSGMKYWSYLGTKYNTTGFHAVAVARHGDIYINQHGGWMPKSAAVTIHKKVTQKDFPS